MTMTTATYKHSALTFGIEIEGYLTAGATRHTVAEALAALFDTGIAARRERSYGRSVAVDAQGRDWGCLRDVSVTGGDSCEIVSPPLTLADMPLLQDVVRTAKRAGLKVNNSCGIHIHIGAKPFFARGMTAFSNLVKLWARFEDLTLNSHMLRTDVSGRQASSCGCAAAAPNLIAAAKAGFANEAAFEAAWYHAAGGSRYSTYDRSRYRALNFHNLWLRSGNTRTIEFRAFNSTLHAGKIRSYVTMVLAMAGHALTARHIRSDDASFANDWTAYAILKLFRTIGLTKAGDPDLVNVRKHLAKFGRGHSGHATPAKMLAWALRHNRRIERLPFPASFNVEQERAALEDRPF
jgi:hypothetical protein